MFDFLPRKAVFSSETPARLTGHTNPYSVLDEVFRQTREMIAPGITTQQIEQSILTMLRGTNIRPYFKNYQGYPSIVSLPVNDEIVHTPPSRRKLEGGDLLKMEFGVEVQGRFAFLGWTFPVGIIPPEESLFLDQSRGALEEGIKAATPGARVGDISLAIHRRLDMHGLQPNRDFVGYQIGQTPKMPPQIPQFSDGIPGRGMALAKGMVLAVIVIAHRGNPACCVSASGWTVKSRDGGRSAYFTSLVEVTADGPRVLNKEPTAHAM